MFVHVVLFWLKENAPASAKQKLIDDCHAFLAKVPTVRQLWAGKNAMTPREVVDKTYDVGLCVILDDAKAHDIYQDHPTHKEFIARNQEHWKRVQVFDFA